MIQDKKILKYELYLDLFGEVDTNTSYWEFESVGRINLNLYKKDSPIRWRRLLEQPGKLPNQQIWWEKFEQYESALLNHTTFESDEDEMEGIVSIDSSAKPKKGKKKDQKKKKESKVIKYFLFIWYRYSKPNNRRALMSR